MRRYSTEGNPIHQSAVCVAAWQGKESPDIVEVTIWRHPSKSFGWHQVTTEHGVYVRQISALKQAVEELASCSDVLDPKPALMHTEFRLTSIGAARRRVRERRTLQARGAA